MALPTLTMHAYNLTHAITTGIGVKRQNKDMFTSYCLRHYNNAACKQ